MTRNIHFSNNDSPVETSQAGPGNLEVTVNGGNVATSAQGQGPHTYAISFVPKQTIIHKVDLRFNGMNVPGTISHVIFVTRQLINYFS